jgi:chitin synthase
MSSVEWPNRLSRGLSRSPSPEFEKYERHSGEDMDVEKALLSPTEYDIEKGDWQHDLSPYVDEHGVDISQSGLYTHVSEIPSITVHKSSDSSAHLSQSSATRHFGPAPAGRVDRRTHNAAGPRRIKQTAVLDENGYFAVEMPIPTRLAQFLPVKGVAEQKSTR